MVNYLKNCILRYLAVILIIFVALTVCINGVLSWWISGSILKPLRKLSLGTKEIREGNLDTPMQYEKKGADKGRGQGERHIFPRRSAEHTKSRQTGGNVKTDFGEKAMTMVVVFFYVVITI